MKRVSCPMQYWIPLFRALWRSLRATSMRLKAGLCLLRLRLAVMEEHCSNGSTMRAQRVPIQGSSASSGKWNLSGGKPVQAQSCPRWLSAWGDGCRLSKRFDSPSRDLKGDLGAWVTPSAQRYAKRASRRCPVFNGMRLGAPFDSDYLDETSMRLAEGLAERSITTSRMPSLDVALIRSLASSGSRQLRWKRRASSP